MIQTTRSRQLKALFLGGILPIVLFAWIEDRYGTKWGLIAGMILGGSEILWEWFSDKRVQPLTWGGNGMLLALGALSLVTQKGVWFKLQPAIMEIGMAVVFLGSVFMGKPLMLTLAQKQGGLPQDLEKGLRPGVGSFLKKAFRGLTFRLGLFFAAHAGIATWAALSWSTSAWAMLKGFGFTLSFIVYVVVESVILRYRMASIS